MKTSTGRKLALATLLTLLLAGGALPVGIATVASPTTPPSSSCSKLDDATLANNVRVELAKTFSSPVMDRIQITAKNRTVTLKGTTNFLGTKAHLTKMARKVRCVRRVVNRVKFQPVAADCVGGQQNCCCPGEGCECVPAGPQCPICGGKRPKP